MDISTPRPNEFGGTQSGLHGECEPRVIASSGPRAPVGSREQRLDLGLGEECHESSLEAFRRNRQHARDRGGVLRMAKGGKAKQRADRGQPRVARADAVSMVVFAVIEE